MNPLVGALLLTSSFSQHVALVSSLFRCERTYMYHTYVHTYIFKRVPSLSFNVLFPNFRTVVAASFLRSTSQVRFHVDMQTYTYIHVCILYMYSPYMSIQ